MSSLDKLLDQADTLGMLAFGCLVGLALASCI